MVAKNLLYIRHALDMSQPKMSEMLGVNRTTYANYERGGNDPALSFLQTILKFTGVGFEELTNKDLSAIYPEGKLKSMVLERLIDMSNSTKVPS